MPILRTDVEVGKYLTDNLGTKKKAILPSDEQLLQLISEKSQVKISNELGISTYTLRKNLNRLGVL